MPDGRIKPIVMPKWGLSMSEGKVTGWLLKPGAKVSAGDELLEVETEKIANVVEAGDSGTLRRVLGEPDTVYPIKALLGVLAEDEVTEPEIDAFVAGYVTQVADAAEEAESGPRYDFVDTAAGKLRYAKRGDGAETIVLIHGFGGDLDNWLFNIDALAGQAIVYALDLPGHGQSTKAVADASIAGLAEAVAAFLDAVGIDTAHLVGHSLGGAVAMRTALAAPDRVKSLTLIGSGGLGPEIDAGYIGGFVAAKSRRDLKPVVEKLFARKDLVGRRLIDDLLKYKRLDGVAEALEAIASAFIGEGRQRAALAEATRATRVPILVIWGEADEIIPAAHATALGERARTQVIGGAGHMVQMEAANVVNALIAEHVAACA